MAVKIADANSSSSMSGSPDKHIDIAPNGTIWMCYMYAGTSLGKIKFFYSRNGGTTWTYAASADLSVEQDHGTPSMYIDADGYMHVAWAVWNKDPQYIRYARGTPVGADALTFSWQEQKFTPVARIGVDVDVIAFRNGFTRSAFICYSMNGSLGCQVAQIDFTRYSTLVVTSSAMGPNSGTAALQFGSIDFAHNGGGKTPTSTPDLYLATARQSASGNVSMNRATYSGGTWSWQTPVVAGTGQAEESCLCAVYDGSRFIAAWTTNSSNQIQVAEWNGVAGSATARNPPAPPGGTGKPLGISLSHDPATNDLYLVFHDVTDGDIRWSKFTRATTTWSAWAIKVSRTASNYDGKVNVVRHPSRDSVDMVYANGTGTSWQIYSQQVSALVRIPTAPTLLLPGPGQQADIAQGATFTWTYNPVSPGDVQTAWAFRRTYGGGPTIEYWNAGSQTWGASLVWNTGGTGLASFPAGAWTTSTTYTWSVRTRSSAAQDSPLATDRTVVATSAPVVDVTGPTDISYGDSTPLITWDYTSLEAQRDFQVRIIPDQTGIDPNSTTPAWDSGVISSSSARTIRVETPLTDGTTYRAYVRATSSSTIQSAWDYSTFTVSLSPSNGPVVTLSQTIYSTGVPRVLLAIMGQTSFLTDAQNDGTDGWENDAITTVSQQVLDTVAQVSPGVKLTSTAAGTMGIRTEPGDPPTAVPGEPQPTGPISFPVVAGLTYTAFASMKAAGTSRTFRVRLRWYDADDGSGTLLSSSVGTAVAVTSSGYTQAYVTAAAPAGAVLARMVVEVVGATASGEIFYMSQPVFAPGTSTTWQPGGYSANQAYRVERSDDGGVTWTTVISRVSPNLAQQATTSDRLMPFGIPVQYRAYTDVDQGDGATTPSAPSAVATTTIVANRWGLRDLTDDLGEMYGYVVAHRRSDDESSAVHRPGGREDPIVDTEGLHTATGSLSIFVYQANLDAAEAVLRRTSRMIVQSPSGKVFLARFINREYNVEKLRHRIIDVSYVEVE